MSRYDRIHIGDPNHCPMPEMHGRPRYTNDEWEMERGSMDRQGPFPKPAGRIEDSAYLKSVRRLPCLLAGVNPCWGLAEADHAGPHPVGRKSDDRDALPLCRRHHQDRTDYTGVFRGWNDVLMRAWCDHWIAVTQEAVDRGIGQDGSDVPR